MWKRAKFSDSALQPRRKYSEISRYLSPAWSQSPVLWGAAALTAIGVATAYALEQRRKRQEEEARQRAESVQKDARRNAAEEMRKVQNYLQGKAIFEATLKNSGLSEAEQVALRAKAGAKGMGLSLGGGGVQTSRRGGLPSKCRRSRKRQARLTCRRSTKAAARSREWN